MHIESFESPYSTDPAAETDPPGTRIFDTVTDGLFRALKALRVQNSYPEPSETPAQCFNKSRPLQSWGRGEKIFEERREQTK